MSTQAPMTIDVLQLQPAERHPTIHAALDELEPGETLELITPHLPQHFFDEFATLRPGESSYTTGEAPDGSAR